MAWTYYRASISADGNTLAYDWHSISLSRSSGNRIPGNTRIKQITYDLITYTGTWDGGHSYEFEFYGIAVQNGPYTRSTYGGSAPTSCSGTTIDLYTASDGDSQHYNFQGGDAYAMRSGSRTFFGMYNCGFEYTSTTSCFINSDSINVRVKTNNSKSRNYQYVGNYNNDYAIVVAVEWETISIGWSSGASLTITQNANVVTIKRNGSASWSCGGGSISYKFYKQGSLISEITGDTVTVTLSNSELGTQLYYNCDAEGTYGYYSSGAEGPDKNFTASAPSPQWSAGAHIEFTQVGVQAHIDLDGTPSLSNGFTGTFYYRLFCAGTRKNSDGDTRRSWTFDPTAYGRELTYAVDAYVVVNGATYYASQLTVTGIVNNHSTVKYHDANGWVECIVYYYDGTQWIECIPYMYDGTRWVECSHS